MLEAKDAEVFVHSSQKTCCKGKILLVPGGCVCGVWVVLPLGSKPALTFYSLVREGC